MSIRYDRDLLSNIQSSYLWEIDEILSNNTSTGNFSVSDEIQRTISPRFNHIVERAQMTRTKEKTTISSSELCLNSSRLSNIRTPWTPTPSSFDDHSQIPMIRNKQSSRLALLSKYKSFV